MVDPISGKIRYVGKSVNPEVRLEQHIKDQSHVYRTCWIRSLLKYGLRPTYTILEVVKPGSDWEKRERYWIAKGHEEGWQLTNLTSGGDGLRDPSPETLAKMSKSQRERPPPSKETLAKRSVALKGRILSKEWKKKISNSLMGHTMPEHVRQALLAANKGSKHALPTNAKLTPEDVLEIRHLLKEDQVSKKELATIFDVSVRSIYNIANFTTWRYLGEHYEKN